jgi:hypothetical protein
MSWRNTTITFMIVSFGAAHLGYSAPQSLGNHLLSSGTDAAWICLLSFGFSKEVFEVDVSKRKSRVCSKWLPRSGTTNVDIPKESYSMPEHLFGKLLELVPPSDREFAWQFRIGWSHSSVMNPKRREVLVHSSRLVLRVSSQTSILVVGSHPIPVASTQSILLCRHVTASLWNEVVFCTDIMAGM